MIYKIGEFSKITKLSIRTLRYYQEIGLLFPVKTDNINSYRYYSEESIERTKIINELKIINFNLEEIKNIINFSENLDINTVLKNKLIEIDNEINCLSSAKNKIEAFLTVNKHKTDFVLNNINIKTIESVLIESYRFKGSYDDINFYINKLFTEYGNKITGCPFSMYYDNKSMDDDADIEVSVPVSVAAANTKSLGKIQALSIIHKGSYTNISASYKKIIDCIKINNYKILYPLREYYIKGFDIGLVNSENFITEIVIPVK